MTKAEQYRRWLARRWFRDGYGWHVCDGLEAPRDTKRNSATLERWLRDEWVERDQHGMHRITELGRDALGFPKL